ncbi:MAG: type II secretion system F family protein [Acidobacteriota bacterium]
MSVVWILVLHFGFALAAAAAALVVAARLLPAAAPSSGNETEAGAGRQWSRRTLEALLQLGTLVQPSEPKAMNLRARLAAAGFRHPAAAQLFQGIRIATAALLGAALGWAALWQSAGAASAALAAMCGAGFGLLLPDRILEGMTQSRIGRIHRALPAALDLMVLSVEAGQSLDVALAETSRELRRIHPELASELGQVQLEIRAGRHRSEVLSDLGRRTGSPELKKLAVVLIDSDRFGTSLAPALRTHARYLRTRRRQMAQEAARKLGVKLIFPVFFLIMPAVFVVTLGPAVLAFLGAMQAFMAP